MGRALDYESEVWVWVLLSRSHPLGLVQGYLRPCPLLGSFCELPVCFFSVLLSGRPSCSDSLQFFQARGRVSSFYFSFFFLASPSHFPSPLPPPSLLHPSLLLPSSSIPSLPHSFSSSIFCSYYPFLRLPDWGRGSEPTFIENLLWQELDLYHITEYLQQCWMIGLFSFFSYFYYFILRRRKQHRWYWIPWPQSHN